MNRSSILTLLLVGLIFGLLAITAVALFQITGLALRIVAFAALVGLVLGHGFLGLLFWLYPKQVTAAPPVVGQSVHIQLTALPNNQFGVALSCKDVSANGMVVAAGALLSYIVHHVNIGWEEAEERIRERGMEMAKKGWDHGSRNPRPDGESA